MVKFTLNGKEVTPKSSDDTPLLWVIRDEFGLKGTKFGCGIARCGACTVHFNGTATRSCILPISVIAGGAVVTIEGLSVNQDHPIQKAWVQEQVPQCGYCQSGQIMQAASMLKRMPTPTDKQIDLQMQGNLCRCMAYKRIKRAIKVAVAENEREGAK